MSTPIIVTVGKATEDVFLQSSNEFAQFEHKGVQYESLPVGQKLSLDNVIFSTGGNATNAAVTFARQGLQSKYIWCLGVDSVTETILHSLDKEGVDTTSVYQGEQYVPSYSAVLMLSGGERTIFNYKGSMPEANSPDFDFSALDGADWVYVSSLGDMELLERIVSYAVAQNTRIMFNPAGSELEESAKLKAILPDIDVLTLNKEDHQVGGRNGRADDRPGHHHGAGEGSLVACLLHGRDHCAAEGCRFGDRSAGNAGEQNRRHHARLRHAAAQMTDQCIGESGQAFGDPRLVHDLAGKDEEWHGQEGEQIEAGEITLRRHGQHGRPADLHDAQHARNTEHVADGNANGQHDEKCGQYPDHFASSCSLYVASA